MSMAYHRSTETTLTLLRSIIGLKIFNNMEFNINISPLKELIEVIKTIGNHSKENRLKELHRNYVRIYFLLNELQDSNKHFLSWLKHSDRYNSQYYLLQALQVIPTIEHLTIKILDVTYSSFSDNSIAQLLSFENHAIYDSFRKFTGAKCLRIEFWKTISNEVANEVRKYTESASTIENNNDNLLPLTIKMIQVNEGDYDDIRMYREPIVEYVDCIVNKDFIKEQIRITENTIETLNNLIEEYRTYLKSIIDIQDLI